MRRTLISEDSFDILNLNFLANNHNSNNRKKEFSFFKFAIDNFCSELERQRHHSRLLMDEIDVLKRENKQMKFTLQQHQSQSQNFRPVSPKKIESQISHVYEEDANDAEHSSPNNALAPCRSVSRPPDSSLCIDGTPALFGTRIVTAARPAITNKAKRCPNKDDASVDKNGIELQTPTNTRRRFMLSPPLQLTPLTTRWHNASSPAAALSITNSNCSSSTSSSLLPSRDGGFSADSSSMLGPVTWAKRRNDGDGLHQINSWISNRKRKGPLISKPY